MKIIKAVLGLSLTVTMSSAGIWTFFSGPEEKEVKVVQEEKVTEVLKENKQEEIDDHKPETASVKDIKNGQKAYFKNCEGCHGNGIKGAAMSTQEGWVKWFKNDELKKVHTDSKAKELFDNEVFKKQSIYLRDFLYKFGSDSSEVPVCN